MARKYTTVVTTIWGDLDFRALSVDAQWLYLLLITQPDLSLCGTLAVSTGRWGSSADPPMSRKRVERALTELEKGVYVVCDHKTDELLVRTFMRHDGVLDSPNILKGAARAWSKIHSAALRARIVDMLPSAIVDLWPDRILSLGAAHLAKLLREPLGGTLSPEPFPGTLSETLGGGALIPEPGSSRNPEPGTTSSSSNGSGRASPDEGAAAPSDDDERVEAVIGEIVRRRMRGRKFKSRDGRAGYQYTLDLDIRGRFGADVARLAAEHPDALSADLADLADLDGAVRLELPDLDCGDCEGTGLVERSSGWARCGCRRSPESVAIALETDHETGANVIENEP